MLVLFFACAALPSEERSPPSAAAAGKFVIGDTFDLPVDAGAQNVGEAAASGDFNGDGHADVAVSAPRWPDLLDDEVYVYFGGSRASLTTYADKLADPAYGAFLSLGAGDVNGDGFDDLVAQRSSTEVDVCLGSTGAFSCAPHPLDAFAGPAVGDLNGDGFADLVVDQYGRWSVFLGSASGLIDEPAATFDVEGNAGYLRIGDVNADGYDDLVRAVPVSNSADTGSVHVHLGSPTGVAELADWTFASPTPGENLDDAALAGDTNGDGIGDLVALSWHSSGSAYTVYRFHGSLSVPEATPEVNIIEPGVAVTNLAGLGDVDGDGRADVGARTYEGVVVYSDDVDVEDAAELPGERGGFGTTLLGVGDLDGDGGDDFLVTAPLYRGTGLARVYFGAPGAGGDTGVVDTGDGDTGADTGADTGGDTGGGFGDTGAAGGGCGCSGGAEPAFLVGAALGLLTLAARRRG